MLPSGLPEHVGDEEDLARFLTQSSQFNTIMVKPAAFVPSAKDGETSVSRHGADPAVRLWAMGLQAAGTRSLYGAAIVKARVVRETTLEAEADEPPPRHAMIVGWPSDADPELQKAKRKELAIRLASAACLPLLLRVA